MKKNFWENKNVLITGFEGFLGSNLTKKLIKLKPHRIVGLDIKVNRGNTLLDKSDYSKIDVIKGSVANSNLLGDIIGEYNINIVFHLAAEAIVDTCFKNPRKTFTANIKGTWELLEVCRNLGTVGAIVVASSDKAYGSHRKLPYKEDFPLQGNHPYDVSKSCADLIAYTYFYNYGLPVAVTRCGNIYGPGDFNFNRIVPDAVKCALTGEKLLIRSDGKFVRDYVFVDDIVNGYLMLAEQLHDKRLGGEAFNFSDEHPITVIELVEKIYDIVDKKPNYEILNQARYEIKYQYLDSKKAKEILKWRPQYSLEEGLRKTIKWYRKNL